MNLPLHWSNSFRGQASVEVVQYQERKALDYTYGLLARALFVLSSPSGDTRRYNSIGIGWIGIGKYAVECPDIARELPLPGSDKPEMGGTVRNT